MNREKNKMSHKEYVQKEFNISDDALEELAVFTILWGSFEHEYFDDHFGVKKLKDHGHIIYRHLNGNILNRIMGDIRKDTLRLIGRERVDKDLVQKRFLEYVTDESRLKDYQIEYRMETIERIYRFFNKEGTKEEQFTNGLMMLYRLRNNLYHGSKARLEIEYYAPMFYSANKLLVYLDSNVYLMKEKRIIPFRKY